MREEEAIIILRDSLKNSFDESKFITLCANLMPNMKKISTLDHSINKENDKYFHNYINRFKQIGQLQIHGKQIDIFIVYLQNDTSLERARSAQRNFIAKQISEAALVAFVSPSKKNWRFSFIRSSYKFDQNNKLQHEISQARRYSFLAGEDESCHTAQQQLLSLLTNNIKSIKEIEDAFSVEQVTQKFFDEFSRLINVIIDSLRKNDNIIQYFEKSDISDKEFAKKLLGQIIFIYFLQKKGWLGVPEDGKWGQGPKNFLRNRFVQDKQENRNFFCYTLEPLFYEALARKNNNDYYAKFACKIPFLNGGLFDPFPGHDWQGFSMEIPNDVFSNGDDGILDIFDRYNFTVDEDEPLDKEVAVDPEMLGKVFEGLLNPEERKKAGTFYTPREIVHYMCQESLILYLDKEINSMCIETIGFLIRQGDAVFEGSDKVEESINNKEIKKSIKDNAKLLDEKLASVRICDPAVGSGAFPVGLMNEIVRARMVLSMFFTTYADPYKLKLDCIENCIYGVDTDAAAVETAKLRLWLSLVVDEDNPNEIKPLPNLDYKIIKGNSLMGRDLKKDLLNPIDTTELEILKKDYFFENNIKNKESIKKKIIKIRSSLEGAFYFGIDFSEVLYDDNAGFDIIIANPPYIGEKGNKEKKENVKKGNLYKFKMARMDCFYYFFHLAFDITCQGSIIVFITTSYYVTADGAKVLRQHFHSHGIIRKLIDFGEIRAFSSAKGQHSTITILENGKASGDEDASITVHQGLDQNQKCIPQVLSQDKYKHIQRFTKRNYDMYDGDEKYIRLYDYEDEKILDIIATQAINLGVRCYVNQGILTGADILTEAHIKNYKVSLSAGTGIFILSNNEVKLISLNEYEKGLLRPWFKQSDVKLYGCNNKNDRQVLYIGKDVEYKQIPNITNYLDKFYPIISKHKNKNKEGKANRWCDLHRTRDRQIFMGPKIVVSYRRNKNNFAYNDIPWYAGTGVFFITPKTLANLTFMKYALAFLNSNLCYFWLYHKGKRKGIKLEGGKSTLESIPVRELDKRQQLYLAQIVDKILNLMSQEPSLNKKHESKIMEFHREINQIIYQIYGLTNEHVKRIESLMKNNRAYDLSNEGPYKV